MMFNQQYIQLDTPVDLDIVDDPEAPKIQASIVKILQYSGIDELHPTPHIAILYTYGFINSTGVFRPLTSKIFTEHIADIDSEIVNNEPTGRGINKASGKEDDAGEYLSDLLTSTVDQPNRVKGDFRIIDLYQYLIDRCGVTGSIETYADPAVVEAEPAL